MIPGPWTTVTPPDAVTPTPVPTSDWTDTATAGETRTDAADSDGVADDPADVSWADFLLWELLELFALLGGSAGMYFAFKKLSGEGRDDSASDTKAISAEREGERGLGSGEDEGSGADFSVVETTSQLKQ